jgi:hypothetical protein
MTVAARFPLPSGLWISRGKRDLQTVRRCRARAGRRRECGGSGGGCFDGSGGEDLVDPAVEAMAASLAGAAADQAGPLGLVTGS